jgi:hypothetical protein
MILKNKAHELVELDMMYTRSIAIHHNSEYLKKFIDSFDTDNFEGEFDIYEISYMKYIAVKEQRYLKACILRDLQKQMLGI